MKITRRAADDDQLFDLHTVADFLGILVRSEHEATLFRVAEMCHTHCSRQLRSTAAHSFYSHS